MRGRTLLCASQHHEEGQDLFMGTKLLGGCRENFVRPQGLKKVGRISRYRERFLAALCRQSIPA